MRREKEDDKVTIEQLEQKRVEALAVVEKERVKVKKERAKYRSIVGKFGKREAKLLSHTCTDLTSQSNSREVCSMPCTSLMWNILK